MEEHEVTITLVFADNVEDTATLSDNIANAIRHQINHSGIVAEDTTVKEFTVLCDGYVTTRYVEGDFSE